MELRKLSDKELAEWRDSPVAGLVRKCLSDSLNRQREAALAAYWAGNPMPESERLAHHRAAEILEDWFSASAGEFNEWMEDNG